MRVSKTKGQAVHDAASIISREAETIRGDLVWDFYRKCQPLYRQAPLPFVLRVTAAGMPGTGTRRGRGFAFNTQSRARGPMVMHARVEPCPRAGSGDAAFLRRVSVDERRQAGDSSGSGSLLTSHEVPRLLPHPPPLFRIAE